jgi:hypothetical protein
MMRFAPRVFSRMGAVICSLCLIVVVLLASSPLVRQAQATAGARRTITSMTTWVADGAWFQRLIFLYASGDAPIQQAALASGRTAGLRDVETARVSAAVRAAWIALMSADPATLGRPDVAPNLAGQQHALGKLRATLRAVAGSRYNALLGATERTFAQATSPDWLRLQGLTQTSQPGRPAPGSLVFVYATSFSIPNPPRPGAYVALPDAFVKIANLGLVSSIPSVYQRFYLAAPRNGFVPYYTVDIANLQGTPVARNVFIADVGPWNEDDNWWDIFEPRPVIASGCPVSSKLVSSQSLTNAQVDSICPGLRNWRRVAYYLLYQHAGLPFFNPSGYKPSGSYSDATNWPAVLPQDCPESAAASVNYDGVVCGAYPGGYNAHNGAWLRDGTYNSPVLNQSAIDLSPQVDQALGWTWPSSGFIKVNVGRLP